MGQKDFQLKGQVQRTDGAKTTDEREIKTSKHVNEEVPVESREIVQEEIVVPVNGGVFDNQQVFTGLHEEAQTDDDITVDAYAEKLQNTGTTGARLRTKAQELGNKAQEYGHLAQERLTQEARELKQGRVKNAPIITGTSAITAVLLLLALLIPLALYLRPKPEPTKWEKAQMWFQDKYRGFDDLLTDTKENLAEKVKYTQDYLRYLLNTKKWEKMANRKAKDARKYLHTWQDQIHDFSAKLPSTSNLIDKLPSASDLTEKLPSSADITDHVIAWKDQLSAMKDQGFDLVIDEMRMIKEKTGGFLHLLRNVTYFLLCVGLMGLIGFLGWQFFDHNNNPLDVFNSFRQYYSGKTTTRDAKVPVPPTVAYMAKVQVPAEQSKTVYRAPEVVTVSKDIRVPATNANKDVHITRVQDNLHTTTEGSRKVAQAEKDFKNFNVY